MTSIIRCILPCKSFDGSPQLTATPPKKGEEDRNEALHLFLHYFLHPVVQRNLLPREGWKHREEKRRRGKNTKSGGSDPTFSAFSRPSEPWGRSRPPAQVTVPRVFSTATGKSTKASQITRGGTKCPSSRKHLKSRPARFVLKNPSTSCSKIM